MKDNITILAIMFFVFLGGIEWILEQVFIALGI